MMDLDPLLDVSTLNKVEHEMDTVNRIFLISSSAVFALGTLLNVWFLLAILTSPAHRAQLRFELLCNICVLHLGVSLVNSPVMVFFSKLLLDGDYWSTMCDSLALAIPLELAHSFILDWLLLFSAVVFLINITGLDLSRTLGRRAVTAGKLLINILPWIASPALYPLLTQLFLSNDWCLKQVTNQKYIYALVNLAAPTFISIVIISVACVIFCKKYGGSGAGGFWSRMLRHKGEVDSPLTYAVMVGVSAASEAALIFCVFKLALGETVRMDVLAVSCSVSSCRAVLVLLPSVLLPDVRDRLRTWRPWDTSCDTGTEQLDLESADRD